MSNLNFRIYDDEYWYGLGSIYGVKMPLSCKSDFSIDFRTHFSGNQEVPFMVSNAGRYIWSEKPFALTVKDGNISLQGCDDLKLYEGFETLRGAYLNACGRFFKPNGILPAENFFKKPQYNTWVELIYDQNQKDVLKYAHGIIDNGLPAGILMIDDGWDCFYGRWDFDRAIFPDPKAMADELHELGFEIMLWICPFVSPDSSEFRYLANKGCLVRDKTGETAIRKWWDGFSAVLDMTNPDAVEWLNAQTTRLMNDYGIDGFKFDAGDVYYYKDDDITYAPATPHEQCELWARYGLNFKYNEYRACCKCAGLPLVQRLCDKAHKWENGVATLIPNTLAQGIMGYSYTCPDMIGGGSFTDFLPGAPTLDKELFVRSAQCSALLPMMQYSAAPWRVLPKEYAEMCIAAGELHLEFSEKIFSLVKEASLTGEPVIRYIEYVYPKMGYAEINDCFMLGNDILCAPVVKKGAVEREVALPSGSKWQYCNGTIYEGGITVNVNAPIDCLPYFIKK